MERNEQRYDGELEREPVEAEAKEAGHDGRLPFVWVLVLHKVARIGCGRGMTCHVSFLGRTALTTLL